MKNHKRSAALIIKNKQILLMHRVKNGKEYYAFPGGTIEDSETPEETAVRELKEETNLDISLGKLLWEYKDQYHHGYYFIATKFAGDIKLGGPELEINNDNNQYNLEWIDLKNLNDILLYPIEIAKRTKEKFE
jgi:8-oxo-dGTP diphosphatase